MTIQQAIPASIGTQVVSALPLLVITIHNADAAPMHTGRSAIAMMVLHHLGTANRIQNSEFRSQQKEMPQGRSGVS
jgi:hypothetical protein